jgi:protein-ribulosamine 3-kinase
MALGEYESQKALAQHLPDNSVVPIAFGTFDLAPNKSFFLTTYRDLKEKTPDPTQLVEVLAKLHSSSSSPTGKFGFHVTTFNGHVPLRNDWCESWEEWYSRQFQSDIQWEQSVRGPDTDFDRVAEDFFKKVIPRLLRPLQSGGRSIKPTLVHGDIWHGNAQIDMDTNQVILFDSCCCYAHNECK